MGAGVAKVKEKKEREGGTRRKLGGGGGDMRAIIIISKSIQINIRTRKVLCGSFLCAIYKFSFIHSVKSYPFFRNCSVVKEPRVIIMCLTSRSYKFMSRSVTI